jgi:hypothetical protein
MHRSDASGSQPLHRPEPYSRPHAAESGTLRAAVARPSLTLFERVRTFVDRTLDAAFGRFDH